MNKHLNTITIAPMTSKSKKYPTGVFISSANKNGCVVLDQIRTIDKQRIVKTLSCLADHEIEQVKLTIKEMLVD